MPGDEKRNPLFGITVRRFIEGKYAAGFKGDDRGPSLSFQAGYRTSASLFFDLKDGKQFAPIVGLTTGTTYVGYGLLDAIALDASAFADVSTKGSIFIGSKNSVHGRIRTSASDPLVPLSPNLDTALTFKAVISEGVLTISGYLQGDGFTGAEVIISYKDGREFLLTHKSEGSLLSLADTYLNELGQFTKKYLVDEDGFIIEELPALDPRYKDLSNTLFDKKDGATLDVYLPPVTQAYKSEEVGTVLHFNDLFWTNDEPTTNEVDEDGANENEPLPPPAEDEGDDVVQEDDEGVDEDDNGADEEGDDVEPDGEGGRNENQLLLPPTDDEDQDEDDEDQPLLPPAEDEDLDEDEDEEEEPPPPPPPPPPVAF